MPTASYRAPGNKLDYTPGSAVTAGDVVVLGSCVCVADADIAANTLGSVSPCGVWRMPCHSGATAAQGSLINWYATSSICHASTGVAAGYLAKARVVTDTTVDVLLDPSAAA